MYKFLLWIIWISLFKYSQQGCSSTVAVTTCTWDMITPNKPLHLNNYKSYLSFSRGNLETVPSGAFKFLPQVTLLVLSFNKISNIENDAFLGLEDLKEINLYDNELTAIEKNIFRHCKKIEKLDLGMNKISSIHDKAFEYLGNLKYLSLRFNLLKTIPLAVNNLPNLETLDLSYNIIQKLKSNEFSDLNKLELLFLSDNKITSIERHSFNGLVNLKHLDIGSNYLTEFNVEYLVHDVAGIKSVRMSINNFRCVELSEIIRKLQANNVKVLEGASKSSSNINGISCKN